MRQNRFELCRTRLLALVLFGLTAFVLQPARADKWALVVGINLYKDGNRINSLIFADADARAVKRALVEAEGVPEANVNLLVSDADPSTPLTESKPDRNAILRALASLARNVKSGDMVFVFFSGHGIEKNGSSYLLPYDTDAFDDNTITDTAIDIAKFRDRLQAVHAGLLVLAFDMCRNAPLKGSRDATGAGSTLTSSQVRGLDFSNMAANGGSAPVTTVIGPLAVVTLFSCSPDERSYEWVSKGRGYFSWFLEQGLRGAKEATDADGAVHVDMLAKYLAHSVAETVKHNEGMAQTPLVEIRGQIGAGRIALNRVASPSDASEVGRAAGSVASIDPRAYISLSIAPVDATVLIDGIQQHPIAGKIALDLAGQATKSVEIGVAAPGFQSKVEQLTLTHGTIVPLSVILETLPSSANARAVPPPSAGPEAPAGSVRINPKDGAEMVYVPAGPFAMGDSDLANNPRHTVTLSGYYIYKNLVTVAMYRKFMQATGRKMGARPAWGWHDDQPIVWVSWDDAQAYCAWAGAALPSEAQWEKAARGTDGRQYPWGNDWDKSRLWCSTKAVADARTTCAVGAFPTGASPYGVLDMAGNAWQWCEDFFDDDYWTSGRSEIANPVNDAPGGANRVIRGGSMYFFAPKIFRSAIRFKLGAGFRFNYDVGFRCCVVSGKS